MVNTRNVRPSLGRSHMKSIDQRWFTRVAGFSGTRIRAARLRRTFVRTRRFFYR